MKYGQCSWVTQIPISSGHSRKKSKVEGIVKKNNNNCNLYIFAGDINIDLPKEDYLITIKYRNILSEFGYMSVINEPTRMQGSSKAII